MTVPSLSPAALAIGLGSGQPGYGQKPNPDDDEEIARKRKLLGSANVWTGQQQLSPAAVSLNLGQMP